VGRRGCSSSFSLSSWCKQLAEILWFQPY
jgi:hypothetical protein